MIVQAPMQFCIGAFLIKTHYHEIYTDHLIRQIRKSDLTPSPQGEG